MYKDYREYVIRKQSQNPDNLGRTCSGQPKGV